MLSGSEGDASTTIQPDKVLPVPFGFYHHSCSVPRLTELVLYEHSVARMERRTVARVVTYGQHSVMVLFHLTFTLPQCSSPESVYLKIPPDSWYAVAQLTARCQLSWGSVYVPQRRVEVLQEGERGLVVVEASTCSSVATQYSFR